MRHLRARVSMAGAAALYVVAAVNPAAAINCREWLPLDAAQKEAAIDEMIGDVLGGQRIRQYGVNRGALGRCLYARVPEMALDFDDACSDSRHAGMQAIETRFKTYVWSCD